MSPAGSRFRSESAPITVHSHGQPAGQRDDGHFIPRRLAICIAQALIHDRFFERIMLRLVEHDPHHLISTA
jgi:hypothetical protein